MEPGLQALDPILLNLNCERDRKRRSERPKNNSVLYEIDDARDSRALS